MEAAKTELVILGDKRLIVAALKNLFDNAIKLNPKPPHAVIAPGPAAGPP